jgi:hypothetical protein
MDDEILENLAYITEIKSKKNEVKKIENTPKKSMYKKNTSIKCQTIRLSEPRKKKNIISIVFPSIRPKLIRKKLDLITSHKYLNIKEEKHEEDYKKIKKKLSKIYSKNISNSRNYYSEKKIRNNDSINDIKNSSFINKKKYYLTSISEDISGSGVSQIGYNLSLSNSKRKLNDRVNNKLSNRLNNRFNNNKINIKLNYKIHNYTPKMNIIRKKIINRDEGAYSNDKFLQKELKLEQRIKLYPTFLQRYSPKLLHRKNIRNNNNKNSNNRNNNNTIINKKDQYEIKTTNFNNQTIPYLEKIDVRQISTILPPIVLGSKYNLPQKTEEDIKRENYYKEMARFERERNKVKNLKKKMTKKEMLFIIQKQKLMNCRYHIFRTKKNIYDTRIKMNKYFNRLKTSLNEFDDWNSTENIDNLYSK